MSKKELKDGTGLNNLLTRLQYQSSRFPKRDDPAARALQRTPPTGLIVGAIVLLAFSFLLSISAAGVWLWMASLDNSLVRAWVLGIVFLLLAILLLAILSYFIYRRCNNKASVGVA